MARFLLFFISTLLLKSSLGARQLAKLDPRIVGGEPASIEDYPYQVSVIYVDSHFCGGSILTPDFILTAAHCTNNVRNSPEYLHVRAGSTYVDSGGQYEDVSQIFQHPSFDSTTYDYDISLLKLSEGLRLGSGVQVVSLPTLIDVPGDLNSVATGWGRLYQNGPLALELQKVELPTIASNVCGLIYGDSLTERMLCAGYVQGQKDTCQGDSGGPLVYRGELIGVTSWGDGCGDANSPGVYANVAYFRDYINGIINTNVTNSFYPDARIIGGKPTTIEEHPYQISLMYIDSHYCGGSLIHQSYVLTAAHCTEGYKPEFLLIRAGSTYLNQGGEIREVSDIFQYALYNPETNENDICVLKLAEPLPLALNIQTINLAEKNSPVIPNQLGVTTGWGLIDSGNLPFELQEVSVPVVDEEQCKSLTGINTYGVFCAGYLEGGKDSCQGDSGGPFVIDNILVGVTSLGKGCGLPRSPGVYTQVSSYIDFIESVVV